MRSGSTFALIAGLVLSTPVAADMVRVASVNLCTDQLILQLADPEQILSLTRVSDDPQSSSMRAEAANYPKNNGGAEEVFDLNPDIVVAGEYSDPATVDMLRRLDIDVIQFPLIQALDEIPRQVRKMGEVLDQRERAELLAQAVEAELAVSPPSGGDAPIAAFYYPNGYSLGAGTLSDDIVSRGGFQNLGRLMGLVGGSKIALETLIMHQPDVLITASAYAGHSRSEELPAHQILSDFRESGRVLESSPDWVCGTPLTLRAVDQVRKLRKHLESKEISE